MSGRKKILNEAIDIWIEAKDKKYIVHVVYDTKCRNANVDYTALCFEDAQKIFASVSNQKLEELQNWDKIEEKDQW